MAPDPVPSCADKRADARARRREVVNVLADTMLQLLLRRHEPGSSKAVESKTP
jgi:hypothetical protein